MFKTTITTRLLDNIIYRHELNEKGFRSDELQLAVATAEAVSFFAYPQLKVGLFTLQIANTHSKNVIYSVTTIPGARGDNVAFVTGDGRLYLTDSRGFLIREQIVSANTLWYVTHARIKGKMYLFAACTDNTIRVFDIAGEELSVMQTPDKILSIDIKKINDRVKIIGGAQNQRRVYLWDLNDIIARRDTTPQAILQGGKQPAFSARFVDIGEDLWIAHSSWDHNVYLYQLPVKINDKTVPPKIVLKGKNPIYPIQQVNIGNQTYILSGDENGDIFAWNITHPQNKKTPDYTIAHLKSRVKCLTACKIDGQTILFAGCRNGKLRLFQLNNLKEPQFVEEQNTGESEIRGIEFLRV